MMNAKEKLNKMVYQLRDLNCFPELESGIGSAWVDKQTPFILELLTLRRLILKHHRLAEMDCNGEGFINGSFYRLDGSTPGAYVQRHECKKNLCDSPLHLYYKESQPAEEEISIFEFESDKVEAKIKDIAKRLGLRVEFQGDPRGYTVKVFKGDRFLDIQG